MYVCMHVCKGGPLPNTKKKNNNKKILSHLLLAWLTHTGSALPKKDQFKLDLFAMHCCCFPTSENKMYSPQ